MHSLQWYGQEELKYDDYAYTITSSYSDGQLKMCTSHPVQSTASSNRSEYVMTQVNTWGMTGNAETFRQGAGAFRNGRDWAREQRDEAIEVANASVNLEKKDNGANSQASQSSFRTETSEDEPSADQTTSQGSQTSLPPDSRTTDHTQDSESSMNELAFNFKVRGKPLCGPTSLYVSQSVFFYERNL